MNLDHIKFNILLYRLKLIKCHYISLKLKRQYAMNYIISYCSSCNSISCNSNSNSNTYLCIDCILKISFISLWKWNYNFDNNNLKKIIFIYLLYTEYNMCNNMIHIFISNI